MTFLILICVLVGIGVIQMVSEQMTGRRSRRNCTCATCSPASERPYWMDPERGARTPQPKRPETPERPQVPDGE